MQIVHHKTDCSEDMLPLTNLIIAMTSCRSFSVTKLPMGYKLWMDTAGGQTVHRTPLKHCVKKCPLHLLNQHFTCSNMYEHLPHYSILRKTCKLVLCNVTIVLGQSQNVRRRTANRDISGIPLRTMQKLLRILIVLYEIYPRDRDREIVCPLLHCCSLEVSADWAASTFSSSCQLQSFCSCGTTRLSCNILLICPAKKHFVYQ